MVQCVKGVMTAVPPKFCWLPRSDRRHIPQKCASPYTERHMAECFKPCKPWKKADGYSYDAESYWVAGGTCWEKCLYGYKDHGATCYKSAFRWYVKSHYW